MDVNAKLSIPAVEQLLKMTASGIGAVAGPILRRWQARTDADGLRIEAQGKADSMRLITAAQADASDKLNLIASEGHAEIDIRKEIQTRLSFQEEKRQSNIESVVRSAAENLGVKQVESNEIDHDWTATFFADVQDVSSAQMQQIWAKVLAGEVEKSGTTSMRTLSILKTMSQRDAELFQRLLQFVMEIFVLRREEFTKDVSEFPRYADFLRLSHHNLIHVNATDVLRLTNIDERIYYELDIAFRIYKEDGTNFDLDIPIFSLTASGRELHKLLRQETSREYLKALSRFLSSKSLNIAEASNKWNAGEGFTLGPWRVIHPGGQPGEE